MAFKTYNNNQQDNRPVINTYTPISFPNGNSTVQPSRLSISYFNRLMVVSIALRNNAGTNDEYATFDNDNQISVYVSHMKAKVLHDAILGFLADPDRHNVCVELKNGLLKVSDGIEYGSQSPCISITYADADGHTNEVIYQTKTDGYMAAVNYNNDSGEYTSMEFSDIELNTIIMVLDEYYKASSYAVASTVRESNMYFTKFLSDHIKAISDKLGIQSNNKSNFNNKTFLSGNGSNGTVSNTGMNGVPKGYEASSFDDIATSMGD